MFKEKFCMIKVYDDFFSEDTRKEIWDLLLRPNGGAYGCGS